MSRTAGYGEIPQHLIDEAARRVGLEPGEVPSVYVRQGTRAAYYNICPCCGPLIVVPRRERKSRVPYCLRHEMAHHKLGHVLTTDDLCSWHNKEEAAREDTRCELEAIREAEGKLTANILRYCVRWVCADFLLSERKATGVVVEVAEELGVSRRTLRAFSGNGRKEK